MKSEKARGPSYNSDSSARQHTDRGAHAVTLTSRIMVYPPFSLGRIQPGAMKI
jgi:hypothetical protein